MSTQNTPASAALLPPRIPTGKEIYDAIMGGIEPELTTEGVKLVTEKYKNETPADRDLRKHRYELALERYEEAYEGYMATLHSQVLRYRKSSFDEVEVSDRRQEGGLLDRLSQSFLQAT